MRRACPQGKSQIVLWDTLVTGLGLRCLPSGAKTWVFAYRSAGGGRRANSQRLRLGSWPEVSLDIARKSARGHAGAVAHGRDPAADRREERRRDKATLRLALNTYEHSLKQRRLVNVKTTMSSLRRGLSGLLGRDVKTLTRSDYVDAISYIEKSGRPGAAQDLRNHSRTFASGAWEGDWQTIMFWPACAVRGRRGPSGWRLRRGVARCRMQR